MPSHGACANANAGAAAPASAEVAHGRAVQATSAIHYDCRVVTDHHHHYTSSTQFDAAQFSSASFAAGADTVTVKSTTSLGTVTARAERVRREDPAPQQDTVQCVRV